MQSIIIADNEFLTLRYVPDKKMVYHTIHKPITDDEVLKATLDAGTEALQRYGICKWLSDDRLNGPLSPTFLEWSATNWQPRTIACGWKYWANLVPREMVAAGTLIPVIENLYGMGLRMMVFADMEEALNWIEHVDG